MPLVNARFPTKNPQWLLAGSPSTPTRENIPRWGSGANLAALTSGVMTAVAIPLYRGDLVTNISFSSATTAAGTPTAWWFALYDDAATPALISQSADQTTTAWGANTVKTLALGTAYRVPRDAVYWAAVNVTATTAPTLSGASALAAVAGGPLTADVAYAVTSGSSLTTTAPATLASPTEVGTIPYVVLS